MPVHRFQPRLQQLSHGQKRLQAARRSPLYCSPLRPLNRHAGPWRLLACSACRSCVRMKLAPYELPVRRVDSDEGLEQGSTLAAQPAVPPTCCACFAVTHQDNMFLQDGALVALYVQNTLASIIHAVFDTRKGSHLLLSFAVGSGTSLFCGHISIERSGHRLVLHGWKIGVRPYTHTAHRIGPSYHKMRLSPCALC